MVFGLSPTAPSLLGSLSAAVHPPPEVSSPATMVADHGCSGTGCSCGCGSRCFSRCSCS